MDTQQIFDQVAEHLLKQNKQAYREDIESCAYLTDEGLRCAVGCLIPDGHEGLHYDGTLVDLLMDYPDLISVFGIKEKNDNEQLLIRLQELHDWKEPDYWLEGLYKIAKKLWS